jgi:DtxR family Mn-dependent transcriptional regulator
VRPLEAAAGLGAPVDVVVRRISEPLQTDEKFMAELRRAGVLPGRTVRARRTDSAMVVGEDDKTLELTGDTASHVFVTA